MANLSGQQQASILSSFDVHERNGAAELLPAVYGELHEQARRYLQGQRVDHTLQPTALVNEAFIKLCRADAPWEDRDHFCRVASAAMRHILVNHARDRARIKRGGNRQRTTLDDVVDTLEEQSDDLVVIDDALRELAEFDPRPARVVEMRFFGGMTIGETAQALGVSEATVKNDWQVAKMWLLRALEDPA